jgi:hypothetical protein
LPCQFFKYPLKSVLPLLLVVLQAKFLDLHRDFRHREVGNISGVKLFERDVEALAGLGYLWEDYVLGKEGGEVRDAVDVCYGGGFGGRGSHIGLTALMGRENFD